MLEAAQLNAMKTTVPANGMRYGLGLYRQETPCGEVWGHDGRTLGHASVTLVGQDGRVSFSGDVNTVMLPGEGQESADSSSQYAATAQAFQTAGVCEMFDQAAPAG